jgi:hypothetical protein
MALPKPCRKCGKKIINRTRFAQLCAKCLNKVRKAPGKGSKRMIKPCERCKRVKRIYAKGKCISCYNSTWRSNKIRMLRELEQKE